MSANDPKRTSGLYVPNFSDVNVYEAEFGLQVLAISGFGPSGESQQIATIGPKFWIQLNALPQDYGRQ